MRSIFGVLSLLIVVALVGVLAKRQLISVQDTKSPAVAGSAPAITFKVDPNANAQQRSEQIQQQFKAAAEAATQPPRDLPNEK